MVQSDPVWQEDWPWPGHIRRLTAANGQQTRVKAVAGATRAPWREWRSFVRISGPHLADHLCLVAQFRLLSRTCCLWHVVFFLIPRFKQPKVNWSITAGDIHSCQRVAVLESAAGCWRQKNEYMMLKLIHAWCLISYYASKAQQRPEKLKAEQLNRTPRQTKIHIWNMSTKKRSYRFVGGIFCFLLSLLKWSEIWRNRFWSGGRVENHVPEHYSLKLHRSHSLFTPCNHTIYTHNSLLSVAEFTPCNLFWLSTAMTALPY